jgi:hypothetical protein
MRSAPFGSTWTRGDASARARSTCWCGPSACSSTAPGADPALSNQLALEIGVIVNYGDSVLVIGSAGGRRLRMRGAGAPPDAVREGATVIVGWKPGDEHLITP